jgi:hypothetical protein
MDMSTLSILKAQVKELEKLLELKDKRIKELEKTINENVLFPRIGTGSSGTITVPSQWTICDHVYPTPWLGTVPPACLKCGQPAPYTVTLTNSTASGE